MVKKRLREVTEMKRVTRKAYVYVCDICGREWSTKKEAEKCEKQKPYNIYLYKFKDEKTDKWRVGDIAVWIERGEVKGAVKIVDTCTEKHCVYPVFDNPDVDEFDVIVLPRRLTQQICRLRRRN